MSLRSPRSHYPGHQFPLAELSNENKPRKIVVRVVYIKLHQLIPSQTPSPHYENKYNYVDLLICSLLVNCRGCELMKLGCTFGRCYSCLLGGERELSPEQVTLEQQWAVLYGESGNGSGLTMDDSARQLVDQYHPHEPHSGHEVFGPSS